MHITGTRGGTPESGKEQMIVIYRADQTLCQPRELYCACSVSVTRLHATCNQLFWIWSLIDCSAIMLCNVGWHPERKEKHSVYLMCRKQKISGLTLKMRENGGFNYNAFMTRLSNNDSLIYCGLPRRNLHRYVHRPCQIKLSDETTMSVPASGHTKILPGRTPVSQGEI